MLMPPNGTSGGARFTGVNISFIRASSLRSTIEI